MAVSRRKEFRVTWAAVRRANRRKAPLYPALESEGRFADHHGPSILRQQMRLYHYKLQPTQSVLRDKGNGLQFCQWILGR